MRFINTFITIISHFLPTLYQHIINYLSPIRLPLDSDQRTAMDHPQDGSCDTLPFLPTTDRTEFSARGCIIYGYPSTGGVLIKQADLLDMLFLSLPRFHVSLRSSNADEEDRFCRLLRRTGAKLWASKEDWIEALIGRDMTEEEERVVVFGWPADGVGVWVLRFASAGQLPRGFGRIRLSMNMEERILVMREYGAEFVEDVSQVEELYDGF